MHPDRIAELLRPFIDSSRETPVHSLLPAQLRHISMYVDLLLRWNARVNLTSVREPEGIVTRHFGESFFAARHLFPPPDQIPAEASPGVHVIDVGSGAGFPGLPIKIWAPQLQLTLIESNQKKATFLREVMRCLTLTNVNVFAGRAADYPAGQSSHRSSRHESTRQNRSSLDAKGPDAKKSGDVVTLRAVEHFDSILPAAADLVAPSGRLAILIGQAQLDRVRHLVSSFRWADPIKLPQSSSRFLLLGNNESR
jgi:16S rRNA (guanine527-N7)-methyltransferase